MTNSFLLKDRSGKPQGYLLSCGEEICCRISGACRGAELCVYEGRKGSRFNLEETNLEQVFSYRLAGIDCAVVYTHGQAALASDWTLAEAVLSEHSDVFNSEAAGKHEPEEPPAKEQKDAVDRLPWPQRRWPPPPCMSGARYVHGRWLADSGDSAAVEG